MYKIKRYYIHVRPEILNFGSIHLVGDFCYCMMTIMCHMSAHSHSVLSSWAGVHSSGAAGDHPAVVDPHSPPLTAAIQGDGLGKDGREGLPFSCESSLAAKSFASNWRERERERERERCWPVHLCPLGRGSLFVSASKCTDLSVFLLNYDHKY